jgi:hypothetical protein
VITNLSGTIPVQPTPDPVLMFTVGLIVGAWVNYSLMTLWNYRCKMLEEEDELP